MGIANGTMWDSILLHLDILKGRFASLADELSARANLRREGDRE